MPKQQLTYDVCYFALTKLIIIQQAKDLKFKVPLHMLHHFEARSKSLLAADDADNESMHALHTDQKAARPHDRPPASLPTQTETPEVAGVFVPPPPPMIPLLPGLVSSDAASFVPASRISITGEASVSAPWQSKTKPCASLVSGRKKIDGRRQCSGCGRLFSEGGHRKKAKGPKCERPECWCGILKTEHPVWMPPGPHCDGTWQTTCPGCAQPVSEHPANVRADPGCNGAWKNDTGTI